MTTDSQSKAVSSGASLGSLLHETTSHGGHENLLHDGNMNNNNKKINLVNSSEFTSGNPTSSFNFGGLGSSSSEHLREGTGLFETTSLTTYLKNPPHENSSKTETSFPMENNVQLQPSNPINTPMLKIDSSQYPIIDHLHSSKNLPILQHPSQDPSKKKIFDNQSYQQFPNTTLPSPNIHSNSLLNFLPSKNTHINEINIYDNKTILQVTNEPILANIDNRYKAYILSQFARHESDIILDNLSKASTPKPMDYLQTIPQESNNQTNNKFLTQTTPTPPTQQLNNQNPSSQFVDYPTTPPLSTLFPMYHPSQLFMVLPSQQLPQNESLLSEKSLYNSQLYHSDTSTQSPVKDKTHSSRSSFTSKLPIISPSSNILAELNTNYDSTSKNLSPDCIDSTVSNTNTNSTPSPALTPRSNADQPVRDRKPLQIHDLLNHEMDNYSPTDSNNNTISTNNCSSATTTTTTTNSVSLSLPLDNTSTTIGVSAQPLQIPVAQNQVYSTRATNDTYLRKMSLSLLDDAKAEFFLSFVDQERCNYLLKNYIDSATWEDEESVRLGFGQPEPYKRARYGEDDLEYTYDGITRCYTPFTDTLRELKKDIEQTFQCPFNSVFLTLFRDGKDSMSFRSDDERALGANPVTVIVTLGCPRTLILKHKNKVEKQTLELGNGSLLFMYGTTQHYYCYGVPKARLNVGFHLNLTFRNILTTVPKSNNIETIPPSLYPTPSTPKLDFDQSSTNSEHELARERKPEFDETKIEIYQAFKTRQQLVDCGVHRRNVGGICGNSKTGCESVLLAGGYDDIDMGNIVLFTGYGPRKSNDGPNTTNNQESKRGNLSLTKNIEMNKPVRVIRSHKMPSVYAPLEGYRYDGTYEVKRYWIDQQATEQVGCQVYRFLLFSNHLPPINHPERLPVMAESVLKDIEQIKIKITDQNVPFIMKMLDDQEAYWKNVNTNRSLITSPPNKLSNTTQNSYIASHSSVYNYPYRDTASYTKDHDNETLLSVANSLLLLTHENDPNKISPPEEYDTQNQSHDESPSAYDDDPDDDEYSGTRKYRGGKIVQGEDQRERLRRRRPIDQLEHQHQVFKENKRALEHLLNLTDLVKRRENIKRQQIDVVFDILYAKLNESTVSEHNMELNFDSLSPSKPAQSTAEIKDISNIKKRKVDELEDDDADSNNNSTNEATPRGTRRKALKISADSTPSNAKPPVSKRPYRKRASSTPVLGKKRGPKPMHLRELSAPSRFTRRASSTQNLKNDKSPHTPTSSVNKNKHKLKESHDDDNDSDNSKNEASEENEDDVNNEDEDNDAESNSEGESSSSDSQENITNLLLALPPNRRFTRRQINALSSKTPNDKKSSSLANNNTSRPKDKLRSTKNRPTKSSSPPPSKSPAPTPVFGKKRGRSKRLLPNIEKILKFETPCDFELPQDEYGQEMELRKSLPADTTTVSSLDFPVANSQLEDSNNEADEDDDNYKHSSSDENNQLSSPPHSPNSPTPVFNPPPPRKIIHNPHLQNTRFKTLNSFNRGFNSTISLRSRKTEIALRGRKRNKT